MASLPATQGDWLSAVRHGRSGVDRGTDRQGYEDTGNIIEAIMQHFKRKPVFGEAFKVGYPRKWELSDDDMDAYYWGIVNLICETPNTLKNEEVEALI